MYSLKENQFVVAPAISPGLGSDDSLEFPLRTCLHSKKSITDLVFSELFQAS